MKNLLKAILENGGASVNYRGENVQLKSGYQVSKCDLGRVAVADFTEKMIADLISYAIHRGEYAGFWVEDGFVYVDISVRISTKAQAIEQGKQLKQISILRWRDMACLYL